MLNGCEKPQFPLLPVHPLTSTLFNSKQAFHLPLCVFSCVVHLLLFLEYTFALADYVTT